FPAIIRWYFEEYRKSGIPEQLQIKAEDETTQVKVRPNGDRQFSGFPPDSEAKPVIPFTLTNLPQRLNVRFEKAGSPQDSEYQGIRVEVKVSDAWSELSSIKNYSLPKSK